MREHHRIRRWLPALLAAAWAVALAVNRSLRAVTGPSMLPTLRPGERILVLPSRLRRPRRGDVVTLRDPRRPDRETVKRLVGVPGDHAVDGPVRGPLGTDEHVVRGDNPAASTDSRTYGAVSREAITGVAVARLWPPRALTRGRGR